MASCSGNGSRGHHKFTLNVWETYVSGGADNYSTVNWELILSRISGNWDWYYSTTVPVKYKVNIDGNEYTGNIMSYDGVSTVTINSGSLNIWHNSDGSKSIGFSFEVWDNVSANYLPGYASGSGGIDLTTIPRYANITSFSVDKIDETSVRFNFSTDVGCDWAWYSIDGGSTWANLDISNIIGGLSANTPYAFKLRVRRTDSQLTTDSGIVWQTTYNYPYIISADNFIIGNNININIYNPLQRWLNIYILGSDNSTICTSSRSTNGNASINNTSEEINSQYESIPNSNVGTYKVRIVVPSLNDRDTTVNGANYYTNTDDCKPIFNDFTYADVNSTTLALTGNNQNIIPRYSNVKVTIVNANKATAQKYATMNKYSFVCSNSQTNINYSSSEDVEGTINGVKSGVFDVYAIDSRTNSKLVTKIANEVINYTDLIKNSISVSRDNGVSEITTLLIYGKIDLVDFGQIVNSIKSAKYRYKATDSQTWSNYTNITLTVDNNGNYSFNGNIQGDTNTGFDIGNSYNIEVVVSDELSSVIFTANLNSGVPNIALHKNGVGIMGKYDVSVGGLFQIEGKDIFKFSSSELFTGYKWIDDKPIYRKVISVNSPASADVYTTIANMGSNVVDTLVSATSMILANYDANNQIFYNLNIDESDANHYCLIAYNRSNGNIQAKVGTEFINKNITIVLEYTKTD